MKLSKAVLMSMAALTLCGGVRADEDEEHEVNQQMLFFMDSAYVEEHGEIELNLTSVFQTDEDEDGVEAKGWANVLELEYGLTKWLELEVEVPWLWAEVEFAGQDESVSGLGDVELGAIFQILREEEGSILPTVALGFEASLPTGDYKDGLGKDTTTYGIGLNASRKVNNWFFHLAGAFEWATDAKEFEADENETEEFDAIEFEYGAAAVYAGIEDVELIVELTGEYEEEDGEDGIEEESELYLTPGIRFEVADEMELGFGFPLGMNEDAADWGIALKFIAEW